MTNHPKECCPGENYHAEFGVTAEDCKREQTTSQLEAPGAGPGLHECEPSTDRPDVCRHCGLLLPPGPRSECDPIECNWEAAYWHEQEKRTQAEAAVAARDAKLAAVAKLCDEHEHGALRWADPLPVPEWIPLVRAAIGAAS